MKQTLNPWARLLVLMLITTGAVVLLIVTALAGSPSAALASDDAGQAPAVVAEPTAPPSIIYIGTRYNGKIDDEDNLNHKEFHFRREDILSCVPDGHGKCTWDLFLDGSAIGLTNVNVRDFEVLAPSGDVIFTIDRNKTLSGIDFTSRDVIRYSFTSNTFSLYWAGSTVCLDKSNEAIDAVGLTLAGHLVISTWGTATFCNGLRVQDEDLVEIDDITLAHPTPSLYLDGTKFHLTSSTEDISSLWIGNPSPDHNIYLATKGSFSADGVNGNSISGKKSDIFGCSPTSPPPIDNCFFFPFFQGIPAGLNHQIDGISIVTTGPIADAAVNAAVQSLANSAVDATDTDDVDAKTFADAMSQGDPEITVEDFIDVQQQLYLPMITHS